MKDITKLFVAAVIGFPIAYFIIRLLPGTPMPMSNFMTLVFTYVSVSLILIYINHHRKKDEDED